MKYPMPEKKRHLVWLRIKQILIITCITLVLSEIALGIYFRIKDRDLIEAETTDYPYFYFQLLPEAGLRNTDGFKTQYDRNKNPGITRIAVTGGSVAYGNKPEETIAYFLEKQLQQTYPYKKFEVINAGVPAFVVEQEFIMIQLVLQYYKPDIIVSIDGYNDLISGDINRYYPSPDAIPPHNWRDFRSIEYNSRKNSLSSRFFGLFSNIGRLADYLYRRTANEQQLYENLAGNKTLIGLTYANRVGDIYDFCKSKNIGYFHFLQPVNWGLKSKLNEARNNCLQQIYKEMQLQLDTCHYVCNITPIFDTVKDIYLDECHVHPEGNNIIAKSIAIKLDSTLK